MRLTPSWDHELVRAALVALSVAFAAACSTPPASGPVTCTTDADCPSGQGCLEGTCKVLIRQSTSGGSQGTGSGGSSSGNLGSGSTGSSGESSGNIGSGGSSSGSSSSGSAGSGSTSSGNTNSGSGGSGGGGTSSGSTSGGGSSGGSTSGNGTSGAPITCSAPANYNQNYSGGCGTERWSVKTATDDDVTSVNTVPQPTTIAALDVLPVPANQSASCNRNPPTETQVYVLQNVNLTFHSLESDGDYHITADDGAGNTMILEVPFPGCVGHDACSSNQPFLCEITHARAAIDALHPSDGQSLGVGTAVGIGFFDFKHNQTDVAPNAIELHPLLAVCLGQNCDPLQGY